MKFNTKRTLETNMKSRPDAATNFEGGLSFRMEPLLDLYTKVGTALMGENKFYQDAKSADSDLINSIHSAINVDPDFVLKLAVYCREKLYLRSVTTVLLAELANSGHPIPNSRKMVARCIKRPDDMTELLSYQFARNQSAPRTSRIPMLIKNGIREAFPRFDPYQISKYNRDGEVKLRDALFLTHPKPQSDEQAAVWKSLIDGNLEPPLTWEVMRSTGQMNWHQVINDVFHKDGRTNNYMAIIRNLRNCLTSSDVTKEDFILLASMISDESAVLHSKILPFRLLSAYAELRNVTIVDRPVTRIYEALESAAIASISNVPKLRGTSVIAIDVSGSMAWHTISKNSKVTPARISILLGMMANKICDDAIVCTFANRHNWMNMPDTQILRNAYETPSPGGATNGYLVIKDLIDRKIRADRVIFLTDMILYGEGSFAPMWAKYHQMTGAKLYNIDLTGYGMTSVPNGILGARTIGGWSDRIFEMIQYLEKGSNIIDEIKNME